MIESCCQFGAHRQLAGITTAPWAPSRSVAGVLVSAGLVPKFGPFRLYTELARHLAGSGFRTLRFDLGDVGDSAQAYVGQTLQQRTMLEIGAAIEHLESGHQLEGIVLAGLCSGAEDSFRYAEHAPRVIAVTMIDPFSYRTAGWKWRHWRHRMARRSMRLLRLYEPLKYPAAAESCGASTGTARLAYERMEHAEASRILRTLINRGVRVSFIYTGGSNDTFNHPGQLKAMFRDIDFRGLVTVDYFPAIDHTQPLQEDRDRLIETIGRRLDPLGRSTAALSRVRSAGERAHDPANAH